MQHSTKSSVVTRSFSMREDFNSDISKTIKKAKKRPVPCDWDENGFNVSTELTESLCAAEEEEKKRGLTPGTLTGKTKNITLTKEQLDNIIKAKKELSRKARSKMGLK